MKQALSFLSKEDLDKAIKRIGSAAAKLDKDIQDAAMSCLKHLHDHGDIGFVNRLYLALGKGHRKQALSSWFLTYGKLAANDGEGKDTKPFVYAKERQAGDLNAAAIDPWFDHKPDPKPDQVFDVLAEVQKLIKRAKGKDLAHAELLTGLQALVIEGEPGSAPEVTGTQVEDAKV